MLRAAVVCLLACARARAQAVAWPGAWSACRAAAMPGGGGGGDGGGGAGGPGGGWAAASAPGGWRPPPSWPAGTCMPGQVPGTALGTLLAAGAVRDARSDAVVRDAYVDDAMAAGIADIAATGAAAWTLAYVAAPVAPAGAVPGCAAGHAAAAPPAVAPPAAARAVLSLPQASYRVALFADGGAAPLQPVAAGGLPLAGGYSAVGMYRRFDYDLGPAAAWCGAASHGLAAVVWPPDHPGNGSAACKGCGQGGNHELAQDLVSQDGAGWDWQAPVSDRNTGLLDGVFVDVAPAGVLLRDGAVVVDALEVDPANPARAASLRLRFRVSALALGDAGARPARGTLRCALPGLNVSLAQEVAVPADGAWHELDSAAVVIAGAALWWPHTLGAPALHSASAAFEREASAGGGVSATTWRAGLRTVTSTVDAKLGGRVFAVNGVRLWLAGGNWISSDAISRAEYRGAARYGAEVRLHRDMGMNVMRLWGGHGGAGDALWDAADELGVFLFHEFWMSGDNNGRWAGSYSWPLDHDLYLGAVADTVRRTRGHASLLLYCGGNELYPLDLSPPPDILAGLRGALAALDPSGAPFVQSSMASNFSLPNGTGADFDPALALAPLDGNYGINDERQYSTQRNPGERDHSIAVAFEPEIGSVGVPDFESLARFMSPAVREDVPSAYNARVNATWVAHNAESFTDFYLREHIYELLPPGATPNASEYTRAAGLAQFAQYQALFEGFSEHMGEWYNAVIMWKSAAPWPSLRGALYDWYLATSGGFWGARAANEAGAPLHVQLSRDARAGPAATVVVVNRGRAPAAAGELAVTVAAYDPASGAALPLPPFDGALRSALVPGGVARLAQLLAWPATGAAPGATLLWRLELRSAAAGGAVISRSEYMLNTLSTNLSVPQDLSALAGLRAHGPRAALAVAAAARAPAPPAPGAPLHVLVTVSAPAGGALALAVRVSLRNPASAATAATGYVDDRLLPAYASASYFSLLPGESREVTVEAAAPAAGCAGAYVLVDAWNADEVRAPVQF